MGFIFELFLPVALRGNMPVCTYAMSTHVCSAAGWPIEKGCTSIGDRARLRASDVGIDQQKLLRLN